jgi:SAM-dependent methyltransferase
MSKFDAEAYLRHRIHYPKELFGPLSPFVCVRPEPFSLVDLGAGTGLSTLSFLRFFPSVDSAVLIDPDPAMLLKIEGWRDQVETRISTAVATGSNFELGHSADLILIGSAWHWMNSPETIESIYRALKPGGSVFVFEYQFPKAKESGPGAALNEWIRREFNSKWKEQGQQPRGKLDELLVGFFKHREFSFGGEIRMEKEFELTLEDLLGVIVSQSRYLAYERGLQSEDRAQARTQLKENLRFQWGDSAELAFTYRFQGVRFQVRSV